MHQLLKGLIDRPISQRVDHKGQMKMCCHTETSAETNKAEHCSNPAAKQHLECTNSPELNQASPAEELPDQETNFTPTPSVTERRSSRRKKQHLVYNAATGEYVPPASR